MVPSAFSRMRTGGQSANLRRMNRFARRGSVKLPKIETLNQQIDDIEANSTAPRQT